MRRLTLSKTALDTLAKVLAAVLIAIIVVCVAIVIIALTKQTPPTTSGPNYPTTRFTMPSQPPGVYYRTCAEAHADGRWDIPQGDPAYRPGLDKDHNGIACESRKSSRLAGS